MSAVAGRFAERFAHPRLAALVTTGLVFLVGGGVAWALAPPRSALGATGYRLLVVGYLLALAGGSGYVAFLAFEFRDRNLR